MGRVTLYLNVRLDADHAVIEHGEEGTWDGQYTDPGAALYVDGQFHMFRNGFVGWPAWAGTAYLTSDDGFTWTQQGDGPVFSTDDVPYAGTAAMASSVLVEDDGTWVLYFYTVGNQFSSAPASWAIGRATAPAPTGPWTVDAEPVLLPGAAGDWDAAQVTAPSVVKTDQGYFMYYTGLSDFGAVNSMRIGLATSPDGITWQKYGDPVLTPGAEGDWDGVLVHQPRVVQTPDGFVMSYRSMQPGGSNKAYGFATSEDGIHWTKYAGNPYLSDKDIQRRSFWYNSLVYHDNSYYVFVEIQRGYQNQTDIYTAVIDGALFQ